MLTSFVRLPKVPSGCFWEVEITILGNCCDKLGYELVNERLHISAVFCTRNRAVELKRAVHSTLAALPGHAEAELEILIVDDGQLSAAFMIELERHATAAGASFAYINKRQNAGLMRSRVAALQHARHELVLFLDDDVEVDPGYLSALIETYRAYPRATGVGGVDLLTAEAPCWRRWYERLIGFRSGHLGKLSAAGFGGGMDQWNFATAVFETEFLYGCNMSFKKAALTRLDCPEWFANYSLGEDLYISQIARCSGALLVQPKMRVRHYQSAMARDKVEQVFCSLVVNHYHLLRAANPSLYRYARFLSAIFGLLVMFLIKAVFDLFKRRPDMAKVRGSLRGLGMVLADMSRQNKASRYAQ